MKRIIGIYTHMPNLYKFIAALIIFILGLSIAGSAAPTLTTSNASPIKIFKCQPTTITASVGGGYVGDLYANFTPSNGYPMESYLMVNLGAGNYAYTYGNDATLHWGNKSISFWAAPVVLTSPTYIFVYSDACTGTNIGGYQNVSYRGTGFGNFTRPLFTGERNLIDFAAYPFLLYFGYSIYLLMIFTFSVIIYIKNQSIMQPLMMAFLGLTTLALSSLVPAQFKTYILLLMAVAMMAIFYRLFKSA